MFKLLARIEQFQDQELENPIFATDHEIWATLGYNRDVFEHAGYVRRWLTAMKTMVLTGLMSQATAVITTVRA